MGMSVQTNMGAISALKNMNTNSMSMNKSLERLSSGFRINSAADDAAGYAISAKLQGEKGKLEAANQNALQAIAQVKTADAGINEIENMVRRLQVLATQAASSNNSGDILKLDNERGNLVGQIDKIASSTKYNGVSLLDGTSGVTVAGGTLDDTTTNGVAAISLSGATPSTSFSAYYVDNDAGTAFTAGDAVRITDGTTSQTIAVSSLPTGLSTSELNFGDLGIKLTINSSITGKTTATGTVGSMTSTGTIVTSAGTASTFQVGAENNGNNRVTADFTKSFSTAGLSLTGDISTTANAQTYIDTLTSSLGTLTNNRAALGSTINQLGYVSANLATNIEQLSSAISTVKDADMAAEMAEFTKSQVLVQAGTAMLAQANQSSQNVLSLFR